MISLYIDNEALDLDQTTKVSVTLGIGSVEDPSKSLTAFTKQIEVPATARNRRIMGFADQLHGAEQFNNACHPARIEAGGVVVMTGTAQLTSVAVEASATFNLSIIGEEYRWACGASETKLNQTEGFFAPGELSTVSIADWLRSDIGFRLLPVRRGKFVRKINEETYLDRDYTVLADYVPFYDLKFLCEAIFRQWGYTVQSKLFDYDELFKKLIVAGAWKEYDTSELEEKYDFLAGKFASGYPFYFTVNKNFFELGYNQIGRIVDTANPDEKSTDEEQLNDVYQNGNCLVFPAGSEPEFTAPEDMVLGLEYSIEYTTGVSTSYMDDGMHGRLVMFDTVDGNLLPDKCFGIDRKDVSGEMTAGEWLCIYNVVGWLDPTVVYKIRFAHKKNDSAPESETEYDECTIRLPGQKGSFICNLSATSKAELWIDKYPDIPDGIFGQIKWVRTGHLLSLFAVDKEVDVKVKYITQPKFLRQGDQIKIKTPLFSSSNAPAMAQDKGCYIPFWISNKTQVKAFFYKFPSDGATLSFANTLSGDITQMDFLNAVKQMFDLMFYTNSDTKEVFIEPRNAFYHNNVVDWSDRVDFAEQIEIEDVGADIGKTVVLGYQTDDVIDLHNKSTQGELGTYKEDILKYHAKDEEQLTNPQFVPTTVVSGAIPGNPAIELIDMCSGELEDADPWETDLNASMKVCEYKGLVRLPDGQMLKIQGGGSYTPMGAFPRVSFDRLRFEGVNGQGGLKSFYRQTIDTYNSGKRITAYVKLSPADVENIMLPRDEADTVQSNGSGRDFRALYKLRINGEEVFCRLEEIKDYDPMSSEATECVFVKS